MSATGGVHNLLRNEALSLITRIDRMEPFALHIPMVPAAAIPLHAQVAIERHLMAGQRKLRAMVTGYVRWLDSSQGRSTPPDQAQRRFAFLRLRFIAILSQLDIFADVLNQRSEHDTGIWLSGLDVLADDRVFIIGGRSGAGQGALPLEHSAGTAACRCP